MVVGQLSLLLLLILAADASVTAWRRGDRHRALTVGGSIVFFTFVSTGQSLLVFWGIVQAPIVASISFMGLVAVMGHELSRDVFRASQLVGELRASKDGLRENEQRMSLAVDAANLGIWIRDLARNEIWASDKWRELFGFTPLEPLDLESILQRLHHDDREALQQVLAQAITGGGSYETEYRLTPGKGCFPRSNARPDIAARVMSNVRTRLLRSIREFMTLLFLGRNFRIKPCGNGAGSSAPWNSEKINDSKGYSINFSARSEPCPNSSVLTRTGHGDHLRPNVQLSPELVP